MRSHLLLPPLNLDSQTRSFVVALGVLSGFSGSILALLVLQPAFLKSSFMLLSFFVWTCPFLGILALGSSLTLTKLPTFPTLLILPFVGALYGYCIAWLLQSLFPAAIFWFPFSFISVWSITGFLGATPLLFTRLIAQTPSLSPAARKLTGFVSVFTLSTLLLASLCCLGLLGMGLELDGSPQRVSVNPDGRYKAYVIRDDCGTLCRTCTLRVDVQSSTRYFREVYRSFYACDATITWKTLTGMTVQDDARGSLYIDMHTLEQEWREGNP